MFLNISVQEMAIYLKSIKAIAAILAVKGA